MTPADVENLVDQQKFGRFQLRIVLLCLLVQFVDGFDNQAIAFVAPALIRDWHVSRASLGPVFGAGAFGTLLGSLVIGPIGDWSGRKNLMLGSLGLVTVLMALTAQAQSIDELLLYRFAAGLPLGALIPATIVMANEWSPRRHRAAMVTIMACGFALGAAVGGLLAAWLLPRLGWSAVFNVGAAGTALLGVAVLAWMPESLRFIALRHDPRRRAQALALLRRLDRSISDAVTIMPSPDERAPPRNTVAALFADHRTFMTLLLWASFFMNMLVLNFLNNWLPTVLSQNGLAVEQAVRVTTLFQIGGIVGIVLMGVVADRVGAWRLVVSASLLSGIMVALIGLVHRGGLVQPLIVGLAGFCVIGVQMTLSALAATLYPTAIRSTGSSWGIGIGRVGSSLGPLLGGVLIGWHWLTPTLFGVIALFSLCGFGCVWLLARIVTNPRQRAIAMPQVSSAWEG
jgi:AAHS family 4-hydroxybenzoate transporter-like MFS transporter